MSRTLKIVGVLLSLFLIATVCSQIYFVTHDKCTYNVALEYSVSQSVSFKGVIVRNETVVTSSGGGVIDYCCSDGSKISAGSVIANCYSSTAEILSKQRKDSYEKEIAGLKEAQGYANAEYSDADSMRRLIDEKYSEMTDHIQLREFEKAKADEEELRVLMNKYNIITGVDTDYQQLIDSLQEKISLVEQVYREPTSSVTTESGGYFVASTDGYEQSLNYDTIYSMTKSDIENVINNAGQPVPNAIGKCFDSYSCKIIGVIKTDNPFFSDTYISFKLSSSSNLYSAYVEKVEKIDDGNEYIVILNCDMIDDFIIRSRVEQIQLIFDDFDGIRVPRKAIRFVDNQKGVYIIYGEDYIFKKIDVIYEGDDFVLSKITDDDDYLMIYDQIVLEGRGVGV